MVLECFDFFNNVIDGDLLVLQGEADDELEDTEGNGLLFVFRLPVKTFLSDLLEDFLGEVIQISLTIKWLHFEQHE